jgi:hypothetical protein
MGGTLTVSVSLPGCHIPRCEGFRSGADEEVGDGVTPDAPHPSMRGGSFPR